MASLSINCLLFAISDPLTFQFAASGMFMWASVITFILSVFYFVHRLTIQRDDPIVTEDDKIGSILCMIIAYFDMVVTVDTFNTPDSTIEPRRANLAMSLLAMPSSVIISFALNRKGIYKLVSDDGFDAIPFLTLLLAVILTLVIGIVIDLSEGPSMSPIYLANVGSLLLRDQLRGKKASTVLLTLITLMSRMIVSRDWHFENTLESIGLGLVSILMVHSMLHLSQKCTVFVPAGIDLGVRMLLVKRDIMHTMIGIALLVLSSFYWFVEDHIRIEPEVPEVTGIVETRVAIGTTGTETEPLIVHEETCE